MSAWMMSSLRAATAMRVWQRQSMEWMAAVLAADPMAMPRSMSRRLHVGPTNSSSTESSRSSLVALLRYSIARSIGDAAL